MRYWCHDTSWCRRLRARRRVNDIRRPADGDLGELRPAATRSRRPVARRLRHPPSFPGTFLPCSRRACPACIECLHLRNSLRPCRKAQALPKIDARIRAKMSLASREKSRAEVIVALSQGMERYSHPNVSAVYQIRTARGLAQPRFRAAFIR